MTLSSKSECKVCSGKGYTVSAGPANQFARVKCEKCGGTGRA